MEETIPDIDLRLDWSRTGQDLKASYKGLAVYNSVTGFVSPLLSERQVTWIMEHYQQKRKNYVFV